MKRLPIGIQSFQVLREGDYVYVDKTRHALNVITNYKYVFLSRPRRFGKSLFIDTLYHIFSGNKELFEGLYIYDKYDFEPYPVIRISWSGDFSTQENSELIARTIMKRNQELLGIECEVEEPAICFGELIHKAYKKYGKRVVILIDEYDKPILDNISNVEEAYKRRAMLRGIYVQMKDNDQYIHFAFLTGITKFSKASIFSGLNNLFDISLHSDFDTICGYTHDDLLTVFKEHFQPEVDMEKVREWYNGYNFIGEHVYNPFDILQFIANKFKFSNYWWKSGTPFSLIQFLKKSVYNIPQLENLVISETLLDSFDIEKIRLESLLFQAGYLTIDKVIDSERGIKYKLRVPNKEVQISLNELFAEYLTSTVDVYLQDRLYDSLAAGDLAAFEEALRSLFSSIPYTNYVNNTISSYEGYYASVVYVYLATLGVRLIAEDVTSLGRIDLTMLFKDKIYIIEFKVGGKDALQQLKQRRYHEKYISQGKEVYLVGINFDEQQRNISRFEWEKISQ